MAELNLQEAGFDRTEQARSLRFGPLSAVRTLCVSDFCPKDAGALEDKYLCLIEIRRISCWWRVNCHNTCVGFRYKQSSGGKQMKTLFGYSLLLLATFAHAAAPPRKIWTGVPQFTESRILHIGRVPVSVERIEMRSHQMGCQVNCSDGPVFSFWMQSGSNQQNCSRWYSRILALETELAGSDSSAFLELTTVGSQFSTDEGIRFYAAGSVSCHGALDWTEVVSK
jgi:hypothetical protein